MSFVQTYDPKFQLEHKNTFVFKNIVSPENILRL